MEDLWSRSAARQDRRQSPCLSLCSRFEEEQRRKARGSVWTQQAEPGLASARGLVSRPAQAPSAGDRRERDVWLFPGEVTYGSNGWDSCLKGRSAILRAWLERSKTSFSQKAAAVLGIKAEHFSFSWQQQSLRRRKGVKNELFSEIPGITSVSSAQFFIICFLLVSFA